MKNNIKFCQRVIFLTTITAIFASCNANTMEQLQTGTTAIVYIFALLFGGIFIGGWFLSAKDGENDKTINKFGCMGIILVAVALLVLASIFT